jgi:phosphoserine aminotransferase
LRSLLHIPEDFTLVFTSSATEVWERLTQSCVEHQSLHLVNGSFSAKFHEIATQLGRKAHAVEAPHGACVRPDALPTGLHPELVAITYNETSTGASQPQEDYAAIRAKYPEAILAVDIVSAAPVVTLDYSLIDTFYFSVQKGFGLPAGLGVWAFNTRCIQKAEQMRAKGLSIGSYHSLLSLAKQAEQYQTPCTPNVLGIYLLAKVAGDMLEKGMEMITRETKYKAAVLYQAMENSPWVRPFVENQAYRSLTTLVGKTQVPSEALIKKISEKGLILGSGYGPYKKEHIRMANFPTHSKEHIEMLADLLENKTLL